MKLRKLIALVLSVFVMAAFAAVPSFAATDVSSWLEKNVTVGAGDPADINARNTTGTRTLKKVWQTFRYTQEAHPISGQGCFSITKGVLKQKGKTCDIYLVAAHGLETNAFGQNDDMESVMKAGRQQNSPYLKQFMAVIKQTVPKGANLILTGHSLGGMVSQQAAANKTMQKRYHILHVITWGSPLIAKGQIEGQLHRMCAAGDVVPLMSEYTFTDPDAQFGDRNREEADVIPVIQSHVEGYNDKNAWKDYDALGVKGGNAVLKMDDSTTLRFDAPKNGDPTGSVWVAFNNNGNWTGVSILY
ncbi:MAG: hypothetical protein II572_03265 [Clostridia bacterium]|nr:hypothetical protein [Clostridia bacterium]MBQ2438051.1 hypothetical protein [Clostridia bacterium]MBQ2567433.1 hypothetical protein [Clostridia bacterium]MBQ3995659.1 hypothetical protein [Clostridia bacterium]MBQ5480267.1 hypothetical protein [Clostridia bacterium]